MSPHLHIQLSRYQKTTRRPRWVVWLLAGFILLCVAFLFWICTIWFTSPVGLKAAPEGTRVAVQLFVNKHTWPVLEKVLLSTPLISNRNLTLKDLLPFIHGEVIWFFADDGSRSVVMKTNENQLPTTLLDTHHIVVQKVSPHLFLLSEKLQPISGFKAKRSFVGLLPTFSNRLGAYVDRDTKKITPISHKNGRISIELPIAHQFNKKFDSKNIPDGVYLVLTTPVYTKTDDTKLLPELFSSISRPLLSNASTSIFQNLLSSNGLILLQNASNPSFLLVSDQQVDEKERVRLIQTILALKYPQKQRKYLKDQTVIQELVSDPSLISVEQRIVSGQEFHHATTGSASLFISKNHELVLTDSEDLLKSWLNKDSPINVSELCNANAAYISLVKLFESNFYPTTVYSDDISRTLFQSFNDLGLEVSGNTAKLHMCY